MSAVAVAHQSPHRARIGLPMLLFGLCAAPGFWIAQIVLGYIASVRVCYPGPHPVTVSAGNPVGPFFVALDLTAILATIAGGVVSFLAWRAVGREAAGDASHALEAGEGRARFMALWGMLTSIWFLIAIVFNTIATAVVPLCPR
jgi:hypothetical protein